MGPDGDPDKPIRIGELGLGTEAKEESWASQHDSGDPDLYLLLRSRSETTVISSKRFPGHGTLGADLAK